MAGCCVCVEVGMDAKVIAVKAMVAILSSGEIKIYCRNAEIIMTS